MEAGNNVSGFCYCVAAQLLTALLEHCDNVQIVNFLSEKLTRHSYVLRLDSWEKVDDINHGH